jgi:hypothetical protein
MSKYRMILISSSFAAGDQQAGRQDATELPDDPASLDHELEAALRPSEMKKPCALARLLPFLGEGNTLFRTHGQHFRPLLESKVPWRECYKADERTGT